MRLLLTKVSRSVLLARFDPEGGSNSSVAPFWKLLPLIVSVCKLDDAGIEDGLTLLIDGDESAA